MALDRGLASTAAPVKDPCVAKVVTDTVVEAGLGWIRAYASFRLECGVRGEEGSCSEDRSDRF
jgi:hypothetical protein